MPAGIVAGVGRDLLSIDDLSPQDLSGLLDLSSKVKGTPGEYAGRLAGRSVALIFEKPSTRTRVSFEVAVTALGGHPLALSSQELQLGRGETIEDTGQVLSRYVDCIVLRTFGQERLHRLAGAASVPVVNALSDHEHPCQALADLLTIQERKGGLAGLTLAYVGDGNNVAHSLLLAGAKAGMHVRVGTPTGYEPDRNVVGRSETISKETGGSVVILEDPQGAAAGVDVLYTDVWASMGEEDQYEERLAIFRPYQVNAELLGRAASEAIVMHCLPAHRGEEITDEVIDGPRSVVWDQAENRLHTQKALLLWLLEAA
jgi:ornithine carbamoyltransferase